MVEGAVFEADQAEIRGWAAEQRAEHRFERFDAFRRRQRAPIEQRLLHRRDELLVGDVERGDDAEPPQSEVLGGKVFLPQIEVAGRSDEAGAVCLAQCRLLALHIHPHEPAVDDQLEALDQPSLLVADCEDEGKVVGDADAVAAVEYEVVGHHHSAKLEPVLVEVHPLREEVGVEEVESLAGRRRVDHVGPERWHDGGDRLVPVGTREGGAQHQVHEIGVSVERHRVEVRRGQVRRRVESGAYGLGERRPRGIGHPGVLPERDEALEAERGSEAEGGVGGRHSRRKRASPG